MGYRREDGRAGIRNEIWIIPGVGCVDDLCMRLAVENQELVERFGLDGLYAFPHPFGCSQLGEDNEMTRQLLASLANHPNAGAVLVVSLGCENNVPAEFKEAVIRTAGDGLQPGPGEVSGLPGGGGRGRGGQPPAGQAGGVRGTV